MTTDADALERILTTRYSCRGFLPDPIPGADIDRMFALAQRSASWCNSQAWQVHLVTGDETARFAKELTSWVTTHAENPDIAGPASYEGVYLERRRGAGFGLYNAVGIERGDMDGRTRQMLENFRFFGAPHVAVISSPKALGTYGAVDCGAYVSTLLAAAQSLGVNTIAQAAIAMYSDFVHDFLVIPEDRNIVCAVSFGYEDPAHPANAFRAGRAEAGVVITRRDGSTAAV